MKLRTLLTVAAMTAVATPLSSIATLRADPPKIAAKASIQRLPAPPALDPAKRALKITTVFKSMGIQLSPPQTLETRLTPVAPRASNGAQIVRAGVGVFNGADADEPDGSFALQRGTGLIAMPTVAMRMATEVGKLYVKRGPVLF